MYVLTVQATDNGAIAGATASIECHSFLYVYMVAEWVVWLTGGVVAVSVWFMLAHNVAWQ